MSVRRGFTVLSLLLMGTNFKVQVDLIPTQNATIAQEYFSREDMSLVPYNFQVLYLHNNVFAHSTVTN